MKESNRNFASNHIILSLNWFVTSIHFRTYHVVKNKLFETICSLLWKVEQIVIHENPGKLHSHSKESIRSMSIVWDTVHDYSEEKSKTQR